MNQSQSKGQSAVQRAYSSSDVVVLSLTFLGFFLMSGFYFIVTYLYDAFSQNQSMIDLLTGLITTLIASAIVFGIALIIGMIMVRMMRQSMLGNSLQIEYSDYAWLRDWANTVEADLQLPRVEIFITQDPVINAYAFGFIKPYCIVLQSGTIRYLTREEIKAIVVHEMAHIKYGHTIASVYLQPFMLFPVVGVVAQWFAGFWQRRCELTADRLALAYMEDVELVKKALIKAHVGPDVADAMNETARQWMQYTAERPMNRFAQTFSSHPFLVRRISHLDRWAGIFAGNRQASPPQPVGES